MSRRKIREAFDRGDFAAGVRYALSDPEYLAGPRPEVRSIQQAPGPGDHWLAKTTLLMPDGTMIIGVVCTKETFDRAIDMLEGVKNQHGVPATRSDLNRLKALQIVPYIARDATTEPVFQMFGVTTDMMSLTVSGLCDRLGV